jgi:hypothetical protein
MPFMELGKYADTAPATSSKFGPLALRAARGGGAPLACLGNSWGLAGSIPLVGVELEDPPPAVPPVVARLLNDAVAMESVDASGVKCPKLPVADVSEPVSEKKWIVPVSLDAHRIVESSLNAKQ